MIRIRFDKAKARHLLARLRQGEPLQPPDAGGWTGYDLLTLAGTCFFLAFDHAKALRRGTGSKAPPPRRPGENLDVALVADVLAAIETLGRLAMTVEDGDYGAWHAPHCEMVVALFEGKRFLVSRKGEKRTKKEQAASGAS
jgi:hypothetical protein